MNASATRTLRAYLPPLHDDAKGGLYLDLAREEGVGITLTFEVPRDVLDGVETWIADVVLNQDLFRTSYCGYWLSSVALDGDDRVLTYEHGGDVIRSTSVATLQAFYAMEPLPRGWHVIDRAVGLRAWRIGVELYGLRWLEGPRVDGGTYDAVLQRALLEEERYA